MSGDFQDTAQICLNGHIVNDSSKRYPQFNLDFCKDCGKETITQCPNCQVDIRGKLFMEGVFSSGKMIAPKFCHNCGKPYPWTKMKHEAAIELAHELNLERLEELLKDNLEHLASDTPRSQVVAYKAKKMLEDAGATMGTMMRDLLVEIVAETAKRTMFPDI